MAQNQFCVTSPIVVSKSTNDPKITFIDFQWSISYSKSAKSKAIDLSAPTVALHLPRILKPAAELIDYYKSKGFQVILLGVAKYPDACLTDISPFEWSGIFRNCRLVITYRMHDTVFSLKNVTPVITLAWHKMHITDRGYSKYYSLLKQFGLHNTNLVNSVGLDDAGKIVEFADRAMCNFDEQSVKYKLEQLRDQYNAFVDKIAGLLGKT